MAKTEFDHAVVMVRDRLDELAPGYAAQGYTLSERSTHNLGSCNHLIVLNNAYVELLGWPPGDPPRPEIAASPLGLEALVFRTHDAQATYQRLKNAGFLVNPVQDLSRPAKLDDGSEMLARFHTVRFAEQPIPGLRLYFCRHLTPHCVWRPSLLAHANAARRIARIDIDAPDAPILGERLGRVIDVTPEHNGGEVRLTLGNLDVRILSDTALIQPRLANLIVRDDHGQDRRLHIVKAKIRSPVPEK